MFPKVSWRLPVSPFQVNKLSQVSNWDKLLEIKQASSSSSSLPQATQSWDWNPSLCSSVQGEALASS